MARKSPATSEALDDIQSAADKLAEWIQQNLLLVGGGIVALMAVAGVVSLMATAQERREEAASSALAEVRADYLEAMGAAPGAIEVPELANQAAAERIRSEYRERFAAMAEEHAGTVSGALASLEVAQLAIDAGEPDVAAGIYQQVLDEGAGGDRLRGLVLQRMGQSFEDAERWAEAADRHEQAANLSEYPLRHWALVDAARCRVLAGDRDAAKALYERLESQAPDLRLPDHLRVQKREIEAAAAL
ncbi:MAG: hypothetical protein ACQGVC_04625 [Myxococcota bacterium]